ncbi:FMRFamide-activated amiloride-sensitive sodium channel-like [Haliotis asinina]|uniref:FMRFamide-activated amiloride-sensitive sodium channel-like n=1 Tax=Haliotis asinina TaxID=109174 RepID=UPI003531ED19
MGSSVEPLAFHIPMDGFLSFGTTEFDSGSDSARGHRSEHMKFSGLGKFGLLNDPVRMVKQRHRHRNRTALSVIAELGSESNAHGFAKIVTSDDTKRKVIWALLVIMGFTAATLQLSLLVRKYLQFQVVELSEIKESMPVEFPSISVCNIEPISWRKMRILFSSNSTELISWINFVSSEKLRFDDQHAAHLTSIRAFYENLGEEAKFMSHDINDFLINCKFSDEVCSVHNFTTFFDGNYYSCFTFNGGDVAEKLLMHATGPQKGLSLIISLDNDDPPLGSYGLYDMNSNILHSAGVRVVVHAPNTMPSPVNHGFDVPPGYSSSIGLKAVLHTRLSEPYGNCTNEDLLGTQVYRNTFFSCLQLCQQRLIMSQCGCMSSDLPETEAENVTFCGVIENWKDLMHKAMNSNETRHVDLPKLKCEQQLIQKMSHDRSYEKSCKCFQPCHETTFQKSVSLSYWPLEFYQLNALQLLYGDKINQNFMHEAYTYLSNLANLTKLKSDRNDSRTENIIKQSYSLSEKEKTERASNLIRQNLLRLNIYLEDLSVVEFRQLPAYGLADLFADIGGTLGLWMGISVLTIMELMELIARLILLLFNSEKKMPEHDPVSNGMLDHDHDYDYDRRNESPV